jgi:hypothetical protein
MPMIDFELLVSTYGLLEVFKWDRMGDFQARVCQNSHKISLFTKLHTTRKSKGTI